MAEKPTPSPQPTLTATELAAYEATIKAFQKDLAENITSVDDIEHELRAFDAEQEKLWAPHTLDKPKSR